MNARDRLVEELASAAAALSLGRPVRVGIDGIDASGKTRLADELAEALGRTSRQIVRASIDGFHHPRSHRVRSGEGPEGYYRDSHDYPQFIAAVLEPLGPGGSRRFRTAVFDFRTDTVVDSPVQLAEDDAILIADGIFLQRPELFAFWDLRVFLQVSFETSLRRGLARDTDLFGSGAKTIDRYRTRYVPGQKLYLSTVEPAASADFLVDNDDWRAPRILRPKPVSR